MAVNLKVTRGLAFRLMLIAALLSLLFVPIHGYGTPLVIEFLDTAHIVGFGVAAILLHPYLFKDVGQNYALTFVIILLMIVAISFVLELIQSYVGRRFSYLDILRNALGFALGLSVMTVFTHRLGHVRRIAGGIAILTLLFTAYERQSAANLFAGQVYFWLRAPVLATFEYQFETHNWRPYHAVTSWSKGALTLHSSIDKAYSGVVFLHFPSDWSNYQQLILELENPSSEVILPRLKITDLLHDLSAQEYRQRYNQVMQLAPGLNRIVIDTNAIKTALVGRPFELTEVNRVEIFFNNNKATESNRSNQLIIHSVYLK